MNYQLEQYFWLYSMRVYEALSEEFCDVQGECVGGIYSEKLFHKLWCKNIEPLRAARMIERMYSIYKALPYKTIF